MKTIALTIAPNGNPKIDTQGFVGTSCQEATKGLEKLFGGGSANVVLKPEAYMQEEQQEMHQHN